MISHGEPNKGHYLIAANSDLIFPHISATSLMGLPKAWQQAATTLSMDGIRFPFGGEHNESYDRIRCIRALRGAN